MSYPAYQAQEPLYPSEHPVSYAPPMDHSVAVPIEKSTDTGFEYKPRHIAHINIIEETELNNATKRGPLSKYIEFINIIYRATYLAMWVFFMSIVAIMVPFTAILAAAFDVFLTVTIRPFAKSVGRVARDTIGMSEPINSIVRREQYYGVGSKIV